MPAGLTSRDHRSKDSLSPAKTSSKGLTVRILSRFIATDFVIRVNYEKIRRGPEKRGMNVDGSGAKRGKDDYKAGRHKKQCRETEKKRMNKCFSI